MIVTPELAALLNACHAAPLDWQAKLVAADKAQEDGLTSCEWWLRWMASHPQAAALPSRRRIHDLSVPTGSRVYGTPKEDSDWDWVVPILPGYEHHGKTVANGLYDVGTALGMVYVSGERGPSDDTDAPLFTGAYRFGPINMITVETKRQLRVWTEGTLKLSIWATVVGNPRPTREEAVATFQELGRKYL